MMLFWTVRMLHMRYKINSVFSLIFFLQVLKLYSVQVNLPSDAIAYEIFQTCINEFKKKGIIEVDEEDELFPYKFVTANGLNSKYAFNLVQQ